MTAPPSAQSSVPSSPHSLPHLGFHNIDLTATSPHLFLALLFALTFALTLSLQYRPRQKLRLPGVSSLRAYLPRTLIRTRTPQWSGPYTALFPDYKGFAPPRPEPDFDVHRSTEPRYRPFKWGAYQVTMGLRTIPQQDWLHIHTSYPSYIRLREARHATYRQHSVRTLPSTSISPAAHPQRNHLAALEVARAIAAYMANRYPRYFTVSPPGSEKSTDGWDVRSIRRRAPQETGLDLPEKEWKLCGLDDDDGGDDPMQVAGELVPDDLAIMMPDLDGEAVGQYRFVAGSICTPGFWRLDEKLGMLLRDIHLKGKVAQYEQKLMGPMDRWFTKLNPNTLAERNNYFFQVFNPADADPLAMSKLHDGTFTPYVLPATDAQSLSIRGDAGQPAVRDAVELSWSHTTNGPENLFSQVHKGSDPDKLEAFLRAQGVPGGCMGAAMAAAVAQSASMDAKDAPTVGPSAAPSLSADPVPARGPQDVAMRSERQSLRKLPRSGAVLFTIRTYLTPLTTLAAEPGVPGRLASAMRSWPEDIAWYKGADLYRDAVLPYLDEKHAQQLRDGTASDTEESRLKDRRAYPF